MTPASRSLSGRTILMSGGSRGIGLAIALRAARDGAYVAILAKTDQPHPRLEGTIHTAAEQIRAAGGQALPILGDVRNDEDVQRAVDSTVAEFGGIDIVVNNASAIDLSPPADISMKKYDLMQDINARGTFLLSKTAIPHLRQGTNPHILTLSPPLNLDPKWFASYGPYTTTKYGMSMLTLGMHEEFKKYGISVNALWPKTVIATAAIEFEAGGPAVMKAARLPAIMADAAYAILSSSGRSISGRLLIDEEILREQGQTDFEQYRYDPAGKLMTDLFVD